jgi:hypothetical protein
VQNVVIYIKHVLGLQHSYCYCNNSETKLQKKIVKKSDSVEAYGEFVPEEFQDTTIRR